MALLKLPQVDLFLRLDLLQDGSLKRLLGLKEISQENLPALTLGKSLKAPSMQRELRIVLLELTHPVVPIPEICPGSPVAAGLLFPAIGITLPA